MDVSQIRIKMMPTLQGNDSSRHVTSVQISSMPTTMNHIDHETELAVRRFISLIAGRFEPVGAIVYGSRARGTHYCDSDADVAVLLSGEHQRFLSTKLAMSDVAFDVLLETGINISALPVWLDEWEHPEHYSNPALLQSIAREGVRL